MMHKYVLPMMKTTATTRMMMMMVVVGFYVFRGRIVLMGWAGATKRPSHRVC